MSTIHTRHLYRVDLERCPLCTALDRPLSHTDALADEFHVAVRRGMTPIDLTGMTIGGSITWGSRETLALQGDVQNGAAVLTLPREAYAFPGAFVLTLQVTDGEVRHTLLHLRGEMARTAANTLIPSAEVLPTLPDFLSRLEEMTTATDAAQLAAADASQAAASLKENAAQAMSGLTEAISAAGPAIVCEVSGASVICTDAAGRPARSLVTLLPVMQPGEGDPSAENVRPILMHSSVRLYHGAAPEDAALILTETLPEEIAAGSIDWVTGVMTVTHKCVSLVGTGRYWMMGTNNITTTLPDRAELSTLVSDRFVTTEKTVTVMPAGTMRLGGVYPRVCFANPDNAVTEEQWRAQCDANPIQLVYELAEPYSQQLTPLQISLLQGRNALRSEPGETRLAYIADTKAYIDDRLAMIAAGLMKN